ncbi:MAG: electron transfer flavoprotein beta subunit/FixA family protein, partial [Salibacteraceae bacterium]
DVQGGEEVLEAQLPLVLSASKGMSEQRIPNMRGIMAARAKKLEVVPAVEADTLTEITSYSLPEAKSAVKLIDPENAAELIEMLHSEAKVI